MNLGRVKDQTHPLCSVTPLYRYAALSLVSPCAGTMKDLCGLGKTLSGAGPVCGVLGQLVEVMAVKTITADRAESGGGGELPNNGLADKNSSSPLKCGYLMCLTASLSAVPLAKTLMKVVEAGKLQSAQVPLVTEAVMARAALLTHGHGEDTSVELGPLLDIITDADKCVFYQDKFINSA